MNSLGRASSRCRRQGSSANSSYALSFLKRICSAVRNSSHFRSSFDKKVEMIAHQGEAVGVAIFDNLERAITFPHATSWAEGADDAA